MRTRAFRYYYDDTLNGVYVHYGDAMINKPPITLNMKVSPAKQKMNGRKASATNMARRFLEKLNGGNHEA